MPTLRTAQNAVRQVGFGGAKAMTRVRGFIVGTAGVLLLTAATSTIHAAELRVLSIGAARPLLEQQIIPNFEKATGHRVTVWWGPPNLIQTKLFQGEPVDVI